jgi:hypothetical protein
MAGARSRRKTGTHFSGSRSNLEYEGAQAPKKEARPKAGHNLTRCGAIYSEIAKKQWVVEQFERPASDCLSEMFAIRQVFPDIADRRPDDGNF